MHLIIFTHGLRAPRLSIKRDECGQFFHTSNFWCCYDYTQSDYTYVNDAIFTSAVLSVNETMAQCSNTRAADEIRKIKHSSHSDIFSL